MMESSVVLTFPVPEAGLTTEALGHLMPMFLWIGENGVICAAGSTLQKVAAAPLTGRSFDEVFRVKRPRDIRPAGLAAVPGQRIQLCLTTDPQCGLRGTAVALAPGQGVLLNLSFGIGVADAVREHDLTDGDFAPTDLAMEMLYLIEAKAAVAKENRALNRRLQGARDLAEAEALTDTLTGLGNRRALDRTMAAVRAEGRPFNLLHMDLDHFKAVNDSLGHAAGDHLLRELGGRLRTFVRDGDFIARVGGDEFVMILPDEMSADRLRSLGERLIVAVSQPFSYHGKPCRVSLSIGAAMSSDFPEAENMMASADAALYASKHAGRGRYTLARPGS